jgi:cell division protein FtsQ
MARLKPRTLRGSVMQNRPSRDRQPSRGFFYKVKLGFFSGLAALVVLALLWLGLSGWYGRQIDDMARAAVRLSQKAHFAVSDILVEGREHTGKDELFGALGVQQDMPIFAFRPSAAIERLQQLPWVARAVVERRLPGTIYVSLVERVPLARWQNGAKTVVIDREGKELANASPEAFAHLPLVVGESAPAKTESLLKELKLFPGILRIMKAAVRVGERRWNLHLQPGTVARLPEDGTLEALQRLDGLMRDQKILERSVEAIDLRFPGRFILEPVAATPTSTQPEVSRP